MREPSIKEVLSVMFLVALLLGLTVWLSVRDDNQHRQPTGKVVFQPLPTPRLQEAERMIYEQLKKEAAEVEIKKMTKKRE